MPARHALPARRPLRLAVAAALLCGLAGAAIAQGEAPSRSDDDGRRPDLADGWRLVPLAQILEQAQLQRLGSRGAPRLLPLAMMPLSQSTLWFGLSASRGDAARERSVQLELRWSIPLDRRGSGVN